MVAQLFRRKWKMPPLSPAQEALLGPALDEYQRKQAAVFGGYDLNSHGWYFDHETGEFTLRQDGEIRFSAVGQIVGTYLKASRQWQWAWENRNWDKRFVTDATRVRLYGAKESLAPLSNGTVKISGEQDATYLTAVAMQICDAAAAFEGDTGTMVIHFLLKETSRSRA